MKPFFVARSLLLACSLAVMAGCSDSSGGTGASASGLAAANTAALVASSTLLPLTVAETETLLFVREEEKLARDVYLTLYNQWGTNVFQNIATRSEQQHMDSIKILVDAFGYVDPVVSNEVGIFTDPAILQLYNDLVARGLVSQPEALQVGGFIEEFDIKDLQDAIDEAKAGSNQAALILTYENLLCGSRNHLRSFVGQIEASGTVYQAQYVPQSTVDAIVNSAQEKCGQ